MGKGQLLLVSFLSIVAIGVASKANAFTSQPAAAATGGAPLADPDDKLENLSGSDGSSSSGSLGPGVSVGMRSDFQPGAVPGFSGATYDRGSNRGD